MKKLFNIILIVILIGIASLISFVLWNEYKFKEKCPEYNSDYNEWFPYSDNTQIEFINDSFIENYEVKNYKMNHRTEYDNRYKCGCCEEGVTFTLRNIKDKKETHFDFQNYENKKSCFGFHYKINNHYTQSDTIFSRIAIENKTFEIIDFNNIQVVKGKGIYQITDSTGRKWILSKLKSGNKKEEIVIENCYN